MRNTVEEFLDYIRRIRKLSENTYVSYRRDLLHMIEYLGNQGIYELNKITFTHLNAYVLYLEHTGKSPATISRTIASMKAFFHYAFAKNLIQEEPAQGLKAPVITKKDPQTMQVKGVDILLGMPDVNTIKGMRDKAMLELMYATGIRVSELISLKISDVNLMLGFITCHGEKKDRIVPISDTAKKAVNAYVQTARGKLCKDAMLDESYLFLNCRGGQMSRQGCWKIIKYYGEKAGMGSEITPHTLRHSFAAHMVSNGADLRAVQEMMGHANISSTQVYLDMNTKKIREVYEKTHPRA